MTKDHTLYLHSYHWIGNTMWLNSVWWPLLLRENPLCCMFSCAIFGRVVATAVHRFCLPSTPILDGAAVPFGTRGLELLGNVVVLGFRERPQTLTVWSSTYWNEMNIQCHTVRYPQKVWVEWYIILLSAFVKDQRLYITLLTDIKGYWTSQVVVYHSATQ